MIKSFADDFGWTYWKTGNYVVNFKKGKNRVNVYWNDAFFLIPLFTVQTAIDHPRQGKTQLKRRKVTFALLRLIFKNPRIHTSKGYY